MRESTLYTMNRPLYALADNLGGHDSTGSPICSSGHGLSVALSTYYPGQQDLPNSWRQPYHTNTYANRRQLKKMLMMPRSRDSLHWGKHYVY